MNPMNVSFPPLQKLSQHDKKEESYTVYKPKGNTWSEV